MLSAGKIRSAAEHLQRAGRYRARAKRTSELVVTHDMHDQMTPDMTVALGDLLTAAYEHTKNRTVMSINSDIADIWWASRMDALCNLILRARDEDSPRD